MATSARGLPPSGLVRYIRENGPDMDKYYLAKLEEAPQAEPELRRELRLVEIHFSRQPPSFGAVYLDKDRSSLKLATLELANKNVANFSVRRQVELGQQLPAGQSCVHFDTGKSILWEEGARASQPHCILLTQSGCLFAVHLIAGSVKNLTNGCDPTEQLNYEGHFLECRLQQMPSGGATSTLVHLLSEKSYRAYQLSADCLKLEPLVGRYSVARDEVALLRFVRLFVMELNPEVVMIELSDLSLRIVHRFNCLSTFSLADSLGPNQRHLVLSGSSPEEAVILSCSRSRLLAHSLQVLGESQVGAKPAADSGADHYKPDPDDLLPEEPGFELDRCWEIELADIDCIRSFEEEEEEEEAEQDGTQPSCLSALWSSSQLDAGSSWPKFLAVFYKFHLLLYSFEQQPALPFSVLYDRSFLSVALNEPVQALPTRLQDAGAGQQQECVDLKLKPKLLHNFKLIGAQPSDALFNTLFLAADCRLLQCRHFPQLALLVGLTSGTDLLAFRFTSSKLALQKDSLYQQLVADSIKGPALLKDSIERLQRDNSLLRNDISSLESRSNQSDADGQPLDTLDKLLRAELKPRQDIGTLYNMTISLSHLIRVSRIIIISTVSSLIIRPLNPAIQSAQIDNGSFSSSERALIFSNIKLESRSTTVLDELLHQPNSQEEPIQTWAVLDLALADSRATSLIVPMFLMDGHSGQVKVFFLISGLVSSRLASSVQAQLDLPDQTASHQAFKFHMVSFNVKPLMSYQLSPNFLAVSPHVNDFMMTIEVSGNFNSSTMLSWLRDCLNLPTVDAPLSAKLSSLFTRCLIEYHLNDGQLSMTSDDLLALELLKKHVLKMATDKSIKLQVSHSPALSVRSLRHLISLQFVSLNAASRLTNLSRGADNIEENRSEKVELLFGSLVNEINLSELPAEFQQSQNWLEENLRTDIESVLKSSDKPVPQNDTDTFIEDSKYNTFRDLVSGFIIDALVDFDRLQGVKLTNEAMIAMRSSLIHIMNQADLNEASFSDKVLNEWNSLKQSAALANI